MHRFLSRILLALAFATASVPAGAATLTTTDVTTAGLSVSPALSDAAGDKCPNDGKTLLFVSNAHASNTYTVTISTPGTAFGEPVADRAVSIPVTSTYLIGPFPTQIYSDSGGYVSWIITGTAVATDTRVRCISIP